jgi:hypothetical protein
MKIFKKKVKLVSQEEFAAGMNNVSIVLDGMTVASRQQAQMLASMAKQLSMSRKKPQKENKEEKVNDPSFQ